MESINPFEVLFWIGLALVFYTYLGYPIVLSSLLSIKKVLAPETHLKNGKELPGCTLIIPAYNEEECIVQKAMNSLHLNYDRDKLKIVFVTDGSTDETINRLHEIEGIEIWHSDARKGKTAAINRVMPSISSEITVFSDANTLLNENALIELAKHFKDRSIGGVSGEKVVLSNSADSASGAGEGIYWKYESFLKRKDAELHTLVGSAGELFSMRTALYSSIPEDSILDDFMISMKLVEKGYRVAYEPKARATETASVNVKEEYKRKVRIGAGGFQSMARLKGMLSIRSFGWSSFQYISHRVMRWAVTPFVLVLILLVNIVLGFTSESIIYPLLFVGQMLFI